MRSGTKWEEQAKLTASDAAERDQFGNSVALSGSTAVIGAPRYNSTRGAAYVFEQSGASWHERAKLAASDAVPGDFFGSPVAISGSTALIGAPHKDSARGAAYVFVRSGTNWSQQAKLTARLPRPEDRFGFAVGISGETAVVGAPSTNFLEGAA